MSVDIGVTGVQTCALPISQFGCSTRLPLYFFFDAIFSSSFSLMPVFVFLPARLRAEERRVGNECRYRCDWSSDVCSSDLAVWVQHEAASLLLFRRHLFELFLAHAGLRLLAGAL